MEIEATKTLYTVKLCLKNQNGKKFYKTADRPIKTIKLAFRIPNYLSRMKHRCIIVDDEPLVRELIASQLANFEGF